MSTNSNHFHGSLRELEERGFSSNHFVKEINSVFNDGNSIVMSIHVVKVSSMFSISDSGDLIFSRFGVNLVFFAVSKINSSSVKGS